MRNFYLTILLIFLGLAAYAQQNVRYDVEPAVQTIQEDYIKTWNKIGEVDGYRIQILAVTGANSRTTAENEKVAFAGRYPDTPSYLSYAEPYFRIRVGNFSTRLEAYKTLLDIQENYPNAYIVPDKIIYSE